MLIFELDKILGILHVTDSVADNPNYRHKLASGKSLGLALEITAVKIRDAFERLPLEHSIVASCHM